MSKLTKKCIAILTLCPTQRPDGHTFLFFTLTFKNRSISVKTSLIKT